MTAHCELTRAANKAIQGVRRDDFCSNQIRIVAHCRLSGRIGIARSAAMRSRLSAVDAEELATLQVFADIPVEDLATLAVNLKPLRAAAGEVLMRQGERAESFSIITSGESRSGTSPRTDRSW